MASTSLMSAPRFTVDFSETLHQFAPGEPNLSRPFPFQQQCLERWCWAAVAVSCGIYRNTLNAAIPPQVAQGNIANLVLNKSVCTTSLAAQECNRDAPLENALAAAGVQAQHVPGMLKFDVIKQLIRADKPVCVRLDSNGLGHYITIVGAFTDLSMQQWLDYYDPLGNSGVWRISQPYLSSGRWSDTYITA